MHSPLFSSTMANCEAATSSSSALSTTPGPSKTTYGDGPPAADHYYMKMELNELERILLDSHAVFGALSGEGLIERYDVYRRVSLEGNTQQQQYGSIKRELVMVDEMWIGLSTLVLRTLLYGLQRTPYFLRTLR